MVTTLNGRTSLFSAIRRGNKQMVKLLLKPGADVSIRDGDNITAVELAWGMYLACIEPDQESKAVPVAAICTQFRYFRAAQTDN
jgi:hypothetical protein